MAQTSESLDRWGRGGRVVIVTSLPTCRPAASTVACVSPEIQEGSSCHLDSPGAASTPSPGQGCASSMLVQGHPPPPPPRAFGPRSRVHGGFYSLPQLIKGRLWGKGRSDKERRAWQWTGTCLLARPGLSAPTPFSSVILGGAGFPRTRKPWFGRL